MFRGIINLFKSGLILSPMVWMGIAAGIFLLYRQDLETFFTTTMYNVNFYLICIAVAFVYTFAFKQVYKGYSTTVDWGATCRRFVGHSIMLILSTGLSVIFFGTLFF